MNVSTFLHPQEGGVTCIKLSCLQGCDAVYRTKAGRNGAKLGSGSRSLELGMLIELPDGVFLLPFVVDFYP